MTRDDNYYMQLLLKRCQTVRDHLMSFGRLLSDYTDLYNQILKAHERGKSQQVSSLMTSFDKVADRAVRVQELVSNQFQEIEKTCRSWTPSNKAWTETLHDFRDLISEYRKVGNRLLIQYRVADQDLAVLRDSQ